MNTETKVSCVTLLLAVCLALFAAMPANADELVLDESLSDFTTAGDFGISACNLPILPAEETLLNNGEICVGKLVSYFKSQGIEKVEELRFCVDIDPTLKRADYSMDSIVLSIEDIENRVNQRFSIGDTTLKLPAYESSSMKPEAQIAVQLGYDFMERYNENSTEKIKFDFSTGESEKSGFTIAVMPEVRSSFPLSRFAFVAIFATFWLVVFLVLFRTTAPRPSSADKLPSAA